MLRNRTLRQTVKRFLASDGWARATSGQGVRSAFFFLSPTFTPVLLARAGELRYLVSTRDLSVGRELFVRGGFDDAAMERAFATLDALGYGEARQKRFVDIGANIGSSTVPALRRHGFSRALAIEPEPFNFELLTANLALNGVADRCEALRLALSDEERDLVFELSPENSGDHRVRTAAAARADGQMAEGRRRTTSVPGTTFDALVARGTLRLDDIGVVWMDVQGHEGHVLAGASTLLQSDVPVLLEYWPYGLERAGGLDRFEQLVREHYPEVIDVRSTGSDGRPIRVPAARLGELRARYAGPGSNTDLLLVKRRRP